MDVALTTHALVEANLRLAISHFALRGWFLGKAEVHRRWSRLARSQVPPKLHSAAPSQTRVLTKIEDVSSAGQLVTTSLQCARITMLVMGNGTDMKPHHSSDGI